MEDKYLVIVLTSISTLVINVITFLVLQYKFNSSLEKIKISYSGVFKEKLEIHKELLKKVYELKKRLNLYRITGQINLEEEVIKEINILIDFTSLNEPFLNSNISRSLWRLINEFQECFENIIRHYELRKFQDVSSEDRKNAFKKFMEARNKLNFNEPFNSIEQEIKSEIKKELGILGK